MHPGADAGPQAFIQGNRRCVRRPRVQKRLVAPLLAHHLAERVRASPRMSSALSKLAGMCLLGFGLKLAISK